MASACLHWPGERPISHSHDLPPPRDSTGARGGPRRRDTPLLQKTECARSRIKLNNLCHPRACMLHFRTQSGSPIQAFIVSIRPRLDFSIARARLSRASRASTPVRISKNDVRAHSAPLRTAVAPSFKWERANETCCCVRWQVL